MNGSYKNRIVYLNRPGWKAALWRYIGRILVHDNLANRGRYFRVAVVIDTINGDPLYVYHDPYADGHTIQEYPNGTAYDYTAGMWIPGRKWR